MYKIEAFTDGACSGNPGPGGWGVILIAKKNNKIIKEKEFSGGEINTTNNRMELTAAIKTLSFLKEKSQIKIFTDSRYVINGITDWLEKWKKNNWINSSKKSVKNKDLWIELDKLISNHDVNWEWVKGHNNHPHNERADVLAKSFITNNKV
tara:strand:- start:320 stop:772 length:453 start_codon:yes stop_codon:yes gene_type:complete